MAAYPQLKIQYNPVVTYTGNAQNNYVGAQTVAGRRGTLPTFTDGDTYYIDKTNGADGNAGTSAAPKKTLGSLFSSAHAITDISGNGYTLSATGAVPSHAFPCAPLPPKGESISAGFFADANYYTGPAGLVTALQSQTQWSVGVWVYAMNLTTNPFIWEFYSAVEDTYLQITSAGEINFTANGVTLATTTTPITIGKWYYVACTFDSGVSNGKKIWVGTSPEAMVNILSATQTYTTTMTATAGVIVGRPQGSANQFFIGHITRLSFQTSVATTFPAKIGDTGLLALYPMRARCLMETAAKANIVIKDSETYWENLYCPWGYDVAAFSIYAADGQAPTFKIQRGAPEGWYGAGNSHRVVQGGATNGYIDQTLGNDGTGTLNNPALPFKTIQAAATALEAGGGGILEIQDSKVYREDVVFGPTTSVCLRAKAGEVPVLTPANLASVSMHLQSAYNGISTLDGLVIDGNGSDGTALTFTQVQFYNCSIRNYAYLLSVATVSQAYFSMISRIPTLALSNAVLSMSDSIIDNAMLGASRQIASFGVQQAALTRVTIKNSDLSLSSNAKKIIWQGCYFDNCTVTITHTQSQPLDECSYNFVNSTFANSTLAVNTNHAQTNQWVEVLVLNCLQFSEGSAIGLSFVEQNAGVLLVNLHSVVAAGNVKNYYFSTSGSDASLLKNCTSIGATTGVDAPSSVSGEDLVSSGDTTPWASGFAPTNSEIGASLLSATVSESTLNAALSASDAGVFAAGDKDMGYDYRAWDVAVPSLTVDGLIFSGTKSQEAAIGTDFNSVLTIRYCSFTNLGTYAVMMGDGSNETNSYFSTTGHGVKFSRAGATLANNVGYACGGAWLLNYGHYASLSHNSTWACQYGQYDAPGSFVLTVLDSIYAGSGVYDYSGSAVLSYCSVGTIDPNSEGTLDAYSIQLDPLFRDSSAGTADGLQVQALAYGYFYNSSCIGTASDSKDMGAFDFTYGTAGTTWTEIDFATSGYRNPDEVIRNLIPIKLAEGDQEDGAVFSIAATYKLEYTFNWHEATSDMPQAQLLALKAMYEGALNNAIQVDFGLGLGYVDHFLERSQGFEFSEMTGGYADDSTPTPLRTLVIREA